MSARPACQHLPSRGVKNKSLSHSKTMKEKPQRPKAPLSHSPGPLHRDIPPKLAATCGRSLTAERCLELWHGTGWHGMARDGTAQHGTAQRAPASPTAGVCVQDLTAGGSTSGADAGYVAAPPAPCHAALRVCRFRRRYSRSPSCFSPFQAAQSPCLGVQGWGRPLPPRRGESRVQGGRGAAPMG